MISLVRNAFCIYLHVNNLGLSFSIFNSKQSLTHVETARESPYLNMDFRSFDNGLETAIRIDIYARICIHARI